MWYLILTCGAFALAVAINGMSAWLQRKHKFYNHLGPMAWTTHQFVIAPAWVIFIIMSTQLSHFITWPLPWAIPEVGWLLLFVAVVIFGSAVHTLGSQCLTNGNLFGHGPNGKITNRIYASLRHPIYDSITLGFIGIAFITNNAAYIVLAAVSHLLLNHVLVRFEN